MRYVRFGSQTRKPQSEQNLSAPQEKVSQQCFSGRFNSMPNAAAAPSATAHSEGEACFAAACEAGCLLECVGVGQEQVPAFEGAGRRIASVRLCAPTF
jgi:hypothetical protein